MAQQLREIIGKEHVFYDAEDIHVTVRSIEGYRAAVAHLGPVTVEFAGLTASTSGVLLQGWPDASLQDLRNHLYDMLLENGALVSGPELIRASIRKTCHATLALMGGPLEVPERFVEFVDTHRTTYYGTMTFSNLELVRYRRDPTRVAVESLAAIRFGGC